MTITITTIKHSKQRYNTIGDWLFDGFGNLIIRVSDLGNPRFNSLIIIHELVEALLCRFHTPEITTEMVDQFDMAHQDLEEPGEALEAPYYIQHKVASIIEFIFSRFLWVDWKEYEERIKEVSS